MKRSISLAFNIQTVAIPLASSVFVQITILHNIVQHKTSSSERAVFQRIPSEVGAEGKADLITKKETQVTNKTEEAAAYSQKLIKHKVTKIFHQEANKKWGGGGSMATHLEKVAVQQSSECTISQVLL